MYEGQTQSVILKRMLDNSPPDLDTREGSITHDMLAPGSIETALLYAQLDLILNKGFADTTYGDLLNRRVAEVGLTRKPAVAATGSVTFSGPNGTVVPVGTKVSTVGSVLFSTTAEGTVTNGSITVAVQADVLGVSGNNSSITLVIGNLAGVITVQTSGVISGGIAQETDAELLARYFDRVRNPTTSGNVVQYAAWSKEIAGVGDVKVVPLWNGNGTVKVVLLDTDKTAPDPAIVTAVQAHIEAIRPIGATVTYAGATETAINVTATLTLKAGGSMTKATSDIGQGLTDYLKSLAFVDPIVRYSRIANIILDSTEVLDYVSLSVNGGTGNITVGSESVAIKGTVTLT